MGYGTIDGRGWAQMLTSLNASHYTDPNYTWWQLATQADVLGQNQKNPRLINASKTNNFTFYKITVQTRRNFTFTSRAGRDTAG